MNKLKILFFIIYIIFLSIPLLTLINNGGFNNFQSNPSYTLLRLLGLLGITLIFVQMVIGVFMNYWRRLFGIWIFRFHITQGLIAYLIILSHPLFYFINNLLAYGFSKAIIALMPVFSSQREVMITLGRIAIILLTIAVLSGIFRTRPFIAKHWRIFHKLNYVVFVLVMIHSYFIGSDSRTIPFVLLYPVFAGGLIASIIYKLKNKSQNSNLKSN